MEFELSNGIYRLLQYDDCHPLGTLPVDVDSTSSIALWYKQAISEQ
jgi:hypothetical protein